MNMSELEDSRFRKGGHSTSAPTSVLSSPELSSLSSTSTSAALNASIEKSAECLLAVLSPTTDLISSQLHHSSSVNQSQVTSTSSNSSRKSSKASATGSSKSKSSKTSSQNSSEFRSESKNHGQPVTSNSAMPPLNRTNSNVSNSSVAGSPEVLDNEGGNGEGNRETVLPIIKPPLEDYVVEQNSGADREGNKAEEENDGDDNSITSDISRLDNPSDTFHTPSASLHNLANTDMDPKYQFTMDSDSGGISLEHENMEFLRKEVSPDFVGVFEAISPNGSEDFSGSGSFRNTDSLTDSAKSIMSDSRESTSSSGNSASKDGNLQPGTYNSKPSKKKMWYHVFTPSYKTRSGDFRKYFKDLPSDERLIVDYSCALQKEILVQGRMYVSQNYISFYANIFGWQTNLTIRLKDITSITKENTALVIPNAIQVTTNNDKLFFTSFVGRDSSYIMLFKLWQTSLIDEQISTKELWKLVHASYGEELGMESEEESEEFMSLSSGSLVNAPSVSTLLSLSDDGDDNGSIQIVPVCASEIPLGAVLESTSVGSNLGAALQNGTRLGLDGQLSNGLAVPTDLSDSSDSEGETERLVPVAANLPVEIPVCPVPHGEGRMVVNSVIPCGVDELFTMLFTNSKFYLDFHLSRKTFNIVQSDWTENEEKNTVRQVSFTVTLTNKMGPKHSQLTETQVLLPVSKPGLLYAVDAESVNAGIPYADAFYVTCHFCMSRVSPRESRLIVVCQVKYSKSVWVKPFIEKNSYAGLEEFYTSLVKSLNEECRKSSIISASPPASPRVVGKSGSLPRVRRRVGKRRAPDIPTGVAPLIGESELPSAATPKPGILGDIGIPSENTIFIKIILSILIGLLLLNGFLYFKLAKLETAAHTPLVFSTQPISFSNEMPQNHQEWLLLLQKQEALHRFELQKWHDILLSALKILHQAESDLESLKSHITSYAEGRVKEIPSYFKTTQESEKENLQTRNNKDQESSLKEEPNPDLAVSHAKIGESEL